MAAPSTAAFTMTGGSASAVTLVVGAGTGALINGVYTVSVQQDQSGTTLILQTPYGTIEQPSFLQ
jgi:hypothetical protein